MRAQPSCGHAPPLELPSRRLLAELLPPPPPPPPLPPPLLSDTLFSCLRRPARYILAVVRHDSRALGCDGRVLSDGYAAAVFDGAEDGVLGAIHGGGDDEHVGAVVGWYGEHLKGFAVGGEGLEREEAECECGKGDGKMHFLVVWGRLEG